MKGLELSRAYYHEVIKNILLEHYPNLKHTACFIGYGSDVIGYDNDMSRDHMWGPRLVLFISKEDIELKDELSRCFSKKLPYEFKGFSTNFSVPNMDDHGVRHMTKIASGCVNHMIEIETIEAYMKNYLNLDVFKSLTYREWLTVHEHRLLAITSGDVFHDDLDLISIRERLAYYPDDIRWYVMASLWHGISEEEAFIGRCGDMEDELGSRLIAGRIVQNIMRFCFCAEKQYAPYSKWFGTAFKKLSIYAEIKDILDEAVSSDNWQDRQSKICHVYTKVISYYMIKGFIPTINIQVQDYYSRPYQVVYGEKIADQFKSFIESEEIKALDLIGPISHMTPYGVVSDYHKNSEKLKRLYNDQ